MLAGAATGARSRRGDEQSVGASNNEIRGDRDFVKRWIEEGTARMIRMSATLRPEQRVNRTLNNRAAATRQFATTPRNLRVAVLVALFALVLTPFKTVAGASSPRLVVSAKGLGVAALGTRQVTTIARLTKLLGEPTAPLSPSHGLENCGVDATASWHALIVYFNHDVLVGVSLGPGKNPSGVTSRGLHLGDTLQRGRSIYGTALRTSTSQGGAWFVASDHATLDGFLYPSTAHPDPHWKIMTIDAGDVGCPAMSP